MLEVAQPANFLLADFARAPVPLPFVSEAQAQARLFGSDDFAEAVDAFAAKRSPVFGTRQGARQ